MDIQRNKNIKKKENKLVSGKCQLCNTDIPQILENHRIKFGCEGGEYVKENVVILCPNCHSKVHCNLIKIDRWYFSTKGYVLHWFNEKGEEFYS